MIGISTYFQDLNLEYLKAAVNCGVTHIFTSLVVLEEDYSDFNSKLESILKFSKENNVVFITDVSPVTLAKLDIQNIEDIKKLGFNAIRIDGGFGTLEESKKLIENFEVYLNASDINPEFISQLKEAGCDINKISVMHNFYPKVHTGLNKAHMIEINKTFQKLGLRVAAFVQGDIKLRGPVFEGLTTLEKHRGVHPFVACVELLDTCFVNDVYIGDNEASIETIRMMIDYQKNNILTLKTVLDEDYKNLYNRDIPIRRDITDAVVRLSYGRGVFRNIKQKNCLKRFAGVVTVDNFLSGRYEGEINICKTAISSDGKTNIIGHIYPEFLEILNYLNRNVIIRFIK